MALDPSIALQAKLPQLENPLAQFAQVAAIQNAQNQNRLADLKFSEAERTNTLAGQRRNALTSSVNAETGDIDPNKYRNALAATGDYEGMQSFQKSQAEQAKATGEAAYKTAQTTEVTQKVAIQKQETIGQALGALQSIPGVGPQHIAATLKQLASAGVITPEQAQQATAGIPQDPAQMAGYLQQHKMAALKVADQMKYATPDANARLSADTLRSNNAATVGATVRGQDMSQGTAIRGQDLTNERALETLDTKVEENRIKRAEVKDKPLTEYQGKSTGFASRMQEADKLISSLAGSYSPAAINSKGSVENTPLVGGMLGAAVNKFSLSADDQKAEQAQRDFITANLRLESGAVIGPDEFAGGRKQYFPQPGDSQEVIKQKAENRRLAIESLKVSAGPGAKQIDGMVERSKLPAFKPGTPENKAMMEEAKKLGATRPPPVPFDIQALLKKHGGG